MKKNIVIGALCFIILGLSACLYLERRKSASIALKLHNTELNLQAAEAMDYEL